MPEIKRDQMQSNEMQVCGVAQRLEIRSIVENCVMRFPNFPNTLFEFSSPNSQFIPDVNFNLSL